MDRKSLDLLVSPDTRQPLSPLSAKGLEALNQAIKAGAVTKADGTPLLQPLREGVLTRDGKQVFRVEDGIPMLLAEEGIATSQITDFPTQ